MLKWCGPSTDPSRTPSFSLKPSPIIVPTQVMLTVASSIAKVSRQNAAERPHSKTRRMSKGRFSDGKAVRRSMNNTYNRRPVWVLERISAINTRTASRHPTPRLKPNCSGQACQACRARWSRILPNHAAIPHKSRMPRKLVGESAGFPGFKSDLISPRPQALG